MIVKSGSKLFRRVLNWNSQGISGAAPSLFLFVQYTQWWYVVHSEELLRQLPPALRGHVTDLSSFRGRLCALALLHAGNCLLGYVCTDERMPLYLHIKSRGIYLAYSVGM